MAATDIVCLSIKNQLQNVSISRRTITRRIECIDDDVNKQLLSIVQSITWHSISLWKYWSKGYRAIINFIRACTPDFDIFEELSSIEYMQDQTTKNYTFKM